MSLKSSVKVKKVAPIEMAVTLDTKRIELSRARIMARAWSETITETRRTSQAALFARAAMETFAADIVPGFALSGPFVAMRGRLDATARQLAQSIGQEAKALPLLEGCHFLTSLYTALLPRRERSALGAFYTPPALTHRLLDLAGEGGLDWSSARVLDPASGGGAFLLEAATRMRRALDGSEPALILAQLGTRLSGFELDPHAAGLSQAALEVLLSDLSAASGRKVPVFVKVCDTLEETPAAQFDLVVGNPPYGRVTLTAAQRSRYARGLYGHANLYGVFTDIALRWARPGGMIAYLTPTSVLGGQYYTALRRLLAAEAPPVAIDFVHARRGVFEDVLQETLLALYRKGGERQRFQVHYLNVDNEREARLTKNGRVSLPNDAGAPWLAPREPAHVGLIKAAEGMPARLSDWGYGVSTGPLVWNRFKSQLRGRAARGLHPLIWAEAVTADGRFIFRAEKKNHAPYFKTEAGDGWLVVDQSCVLVQRTTAKEQLRRLIAAELPQSFIDAHDGVVIENHLNMVRAIGKPKVTPAAVAAVLNSDVLDQIFRCISGSVAVSAFELESIPLPPLSAMAPIERLIAKGATRAAIEKVLCGLYGLKA
ncbi:HsdM family class I SAM-dependent methyltransferase [Acetobacter pasteurianus]|uniref:site-specific DNA-methyltransferase (adenine-specific) n=1 Tax=Acetobacter pasteurianus TaxID=438 RepID=A0A1A0CSQ0_ACEPA|nr:N-6 DNA methylase [Acetobacter pasteurianus]OAZ65934.1 Site-specific DNA-methyltransferase (adenine-specific) [Acetobacter pasteurianus]